MGDSKENQKIVAVVEQLVGHVKHPFYKRYGGFVVLFWGFFFIRRSNCSLIFWGKETDIHIA